MKKIIKSLNSLKMDDFNDEQKRVTNVMCKWLDEFRSHRTIALKTSPKKRKSTSLVEEEQTSEANIKMVKYKLNATPNFALYADDGMGKSTVINYVAELKKYHVHKLTNNFFQSVSTDKHFMEDLIIDIESGHVHDNIHKKPVILVLDNIQYYTGEKNSKSDAKSPLSLFLNENQARWFFPIIITVNKKHTKPATVLKALPKYVEYMNNPTSNFLLKFCNKLINDHHLKIDKSLKILDIVSVSGCTYFTCITMMYELSKIRNTNIDTFYEIKYRSNPGNTLYEMTLKIMTKSFDIASSMNIYNSMGSEDKKQIMPMMITHIDKFSSIIKQNTNEIMKKLMTSMLLGDKVEELINTYQRRELHSYYPLISVAVPCTLLSNCINHAKFNPYKYNLTFHVVANTEQIRNKNVRSLMRMKNKFRKMDAEMCVALYSIISNFYGTKRITSILQSITTTNVFKTTDANFWNDVMRYNKLERFGSDDSVKKKKINDMVKKI